MGKDLVISSNRHETKVAILEDEQLVEVYFQRANEYSLVGSIHKGRVTRVLPGMQSAFVDIGLERDAFLYVSDFFEESDEYEPIGADKEPLPGKLPAAAPASLREESESKDRRGRRPRRRRGKTRGIPETKYAADIGAPPVEVETVKEPEPAAAEPIAAREASRSAERDRGRARERDRSSEGDRERSRERDTDAFMVLPGESLAKYGSQSDAGGPPAGDEARAAAGEAAPFDAAEPEAWPVAMADDTDAEDGSDLFSAFSDEDAGAWSAPGPEPVTAEELAAGRGPDSADPALADEDGDIEDASEFADDDDEDPDDGDEEDFPLLADVLDEDEGDNEADDQDNDEDLGEDETSETEEDDDDGETPVRRPADIESEDHDIQQMILGQLDDSAQATLEALDRDEVDVRRPGKGGRDENTQAGNGQERDEERRASVRSRENEPRFTRRPPRRGRRRGRGSRQETPNGPRETNGEPRLEPAETPSSIENADKDGQQRSAPKSDRVLPSISDLLKEGQEILVQIAKEPLGQKGARITSHIALPGRYVVYMPTLDHLGVSRKIGSEEERQRLRKVLQKHRDGIAGGFIMRTAGEGRSEEELAADMKFLANLWLDIRRKAESKPAPALLHHDLQLVERILRDQVTDDFNTIWVDSEDAYADVLGFLQRFQPGMVSRVRLFTRRQPIFDAFNISQELDKALRPKVWLKSGGYIVINQTEALVAIDINTGIFVGHRHGGAQEPPEGDAGARRGHAVRPGAIQDPSIQRLRPRGHHPQTGQAEPRADALLALPVLRRVRLRQER